jgi:hypothetical protein
LPTLHITIGQLPLETDNPRRELHSRFSTNVRGFLPHHGHERPTPSGRSAMPAATPPTPRAPFFDGKIFYRFARRRDRHRRVLVETAVRPGHLHPRAATCQQPWARGLTIMNNSTCNGWRMEDAWLDKQIGRCGESAADRLYPVCKGCAP